MKDKLSIKERRFLEKYLQGKPLYECAKYAGSKGKDNDSLKVIGYRMLTNINLDLREVQEMNGITDQRLTEKLNQGLDFKKPYFGSWQGEIIKSEPVDDGTTQMKALEIAHRLRGQFIDKTELTGRDGGEITISYAPSKIGGKKGKEVKLEMD